MKVRSAATLGLGGINQPDIIDALELNLGSSSWRLRGAAAYSLGRIDNPAVVKPLVGALGDNSPAVRYASLGSLTEKVTQFPELAENIKPLLSDSSPQIRSLAVSSLGRIDTPETDNLLQSALDDPSVAVRQNVVVNLGLRSYTNPKLAEPLINAFENDSDTWVRNLAGISLRVADRSSLEEPTKSSIEDVTSEIRVAVIIPGVEPPLGLNLLTERNLNYDVSKNWPLRNLLELGGIKVVEHRWKGRLVDILFTQNGLKHTMNKAASVAGNGKVLAIGYSGGNLIAERFLSPDFDPAIRQMFRDDKIDFVSLGSPSWQNFSKLDSDWKNIYIEDDFIHSLFGGKGFIPLLGQHEMPYPSYVSNASFIDRHNTYRNPMVISDVVHKSFPQLDMPQLSTMLQHQDVSEWKYFPTHGRWPGIYDFSSVASPGVWREHTRGFESRHLIDSSVWSDLAVPPGGTGFNPRFMSTPPAGLIQPPVFDPGSISTPPPGAVHINPGIPGGLPYTGGSYTPPPALYIKPDRDFNQ